MYQSRFIVQHRLPVGMQSIRGTLCNVAKGEIICSSVRIQKALARMLSTQYGECTYVWSNECANGSVTYRDGHKKAETFAAL